MRFFNTGLQLDILRINYFCNHIEKSMNREHVIVEKRESVKDYQRFIVNNAYEIELCECSLFRIIIVGNRN